MIHIWETIIGIIYSLKVNDSYKESLNYSSKIQRSRVSRLVSSSPTRGLNLTINMSSLRLRQIRRDMSPPFQEPIQKWQPHVTTSLVSLSLVTFFFPRVKECIKFCLRVFQRYSVVVEGWILSTAQSRL